MTPIDLIRLALRQAGVGALGQTPDAEDANDAFDLLNMMLAQWNRRRWLVYHLIDVATSALGASSYRIGPGQAFDTRGRIIGIERAYFRLNPSSDQNNDFSLEFGADFGPPHVIAAGVVDVPLAVLTSREDYSAIAMKGLSGFPAAVWLDANYPAGELYVWPAPSSGEIHVVVQEQLSAFPDLVTDIALPDEYREALYYNLVVRLRSAYGRPSDPVVATLARTALNTIRNANAQIATLGMPDTMPLGYGRFNIYSGQST